MHRYGSLTNFKFLIANFSKPILQALNMIITVTFYILFQRILVEHPFETSE